MAFDWNGVGAGAIGGAGAGSAFGPIGTAIGGVSGGLLGGAFGGGKKSSETKMQTKQRELVDQLLASLNGNGPYSNLFSANEEDFQKSYVDPAKSIFKNQIAPQIQQAFVGGQYGQQRGGTGLEDSLTRAGVDMDQLLNQAYMSYQNDAKNRQYNAMNQILGAGSGAANDPTFAEQFMQGGGIGSGLTGIGEGYRQYQLGKERKSALDEILKAQSEQQRVGFEPDIGGF